MFKLNKINNKYYLESDYYYKFKGYDQGVTLYTLNEFSENLNIDLDILKNKMLSYNAKFYRHRGYNIEVYFKNKQDGQNLIDELNIILRLTKDGKI